MEKANSLKILMENTHPKLENKVQVFSLEKLNQSAFINQHHIILLGIKPVQIITLIKDYPVLREFTGEVISPLAGVKLNDLRVIFPNSKSILKVMPSIVTKETELSTIGLNNPSKETLDPHLLSHQWYSAFGKIHFLKSEGEFNNLTLVFGSNAAYMATLMLPWIKFMSENGFSLEESKTLFLKQALSGLTFLQNKDLTQVITQVQTPGGITAAGINSLLVDGKYDELISNMIKSSSSRATEIGDVVTRDLNSSILRHN